MSFMVIRKTTYLILVLTFTLHGPFVRLLDAQEEQAPAQEAADVSGSLLAGIITAFNIPSRLILCGVDAVMGLIIVGASGGRRYAQAANVMEEGCAGPWVITPRMISEGRPTQQDANSGEAQEFGRP
jgi:hypothetical protein